MSDAKMHTEFLPAERADADEVARQREFINHIPLLAELLDAIIGFVLILNRHRQAVFVNKAFRDFNSGKDVKKEIIGFRPGEIMGCKHSAETPGGCGTTKFCRECGAAKALAAALAGTESVEECRIITKAGGDDLNLLVKSQPFKQENQDHIIFSFVDISHEKRRTALEHIFFHDVLNTAGSLSGLTELMLMLGPEKIITYVPTAHDAARRLVEQILSQRDLAAAERGELNPQAAEVRALELIKEIADVFSGHEAAKGRKITITPDSQDLSLKTDGVLLSRVIGNMVKNAVEAERAGAEIKVSCRQTPAGIAFSVSNPTPMSESTRLQIFQKSFSTKGVGRGLGTYSIRLLTEKYLKGSVSCSSGPGGTVFEAVYPENL
ncbi:MAG: HAMP domain-containing sensor histidine kinase [Elusimicrobia bacterium]|nr:HAMP domain-containing sensor histidine kinase [Elusimicrobiota bacterium]